MARPPVTSRRDSINSVEQPLSARFALEDLPAPAAITDGDAVNFAEKPVAHYQPVMLHGFAAHWPLMQGLHRWLAA